VASAKDLEGQFVGVSRGYTVTTGVWARSILAEEQGVDLSQITWLRSDEEHVPDWWMPTHEQDLTRDESLDEQLAHGKLAAAVGLVAGDSTRSLITDLFSAGLTALKTKRFYPINHLVVVRDELLVELPELAHQIFEAFSTLKNSYLSDLKSGRISDLIAADKTHLAALDVMDNPFPYGIAPNAETLTNLMQQVVAQGIIDAPFMLEDLFALQSLELVG
jgi:4,5-dihydroxyphthalate decarboxylase